MFMTNLEMLCLMNNTRSQEKFINNTNIQIKFYKYTMGYSAEEFRKTAIDKIIQRNITMAKVGSNPDFKTAHPDWVRDAAKKQFTDLTVKVKNQVVKEQTQALNRRAKLGGK